MTTEKHVSWLAVNKNGQELAFDSIPERTEESWFSNDCNHVELEAGTIKNILGHKLSWKQEPHLCLSVKCPKIQIETATPRKFYHPGE